MGPRPRIDVSSEHTPINYPSRRKSCNPNFNDLTTTVAASQNPDVKEVGQSTPPLLFQEREVSSNPFGVSGLQQQATASGSQQQASSSVRKSWLNADLWGTRKLVRGNESISSVEVTFCREEREIEIWKVCKLCLKREISMPTLKRTELVFQGECAQRRLSEAEAGMDRRTWEQRNADVALCDHQSGTRISDVGASTGESMGRSGSKRKDKFMW